MKKIMPFFCYFSIFMMFIVIPSTFVNASNQIEITSTGGTSNGGIYYTDASGKKTNVYMANYTSNGSDAYCLHPGRVGPDNGGMTYFEDETFDVSNCGSNFTYECGLAFILSESLANDYSYRATETALRLFAAYSVDASSEMSGADGWYDATTGLTTRAKIYQNTARAVMNWGYNVDNYHYCTDNSGHVTDCVNVLYGEGTAGADLKAGIDLFKKVMESGVQNSWAPEIELVDTQRASNGDVTFTLNTNFNANTEISIPNSISGYPITSNVSSCDSGCVIKITVNVPSAEECIWVDFDITFKDIRYALGTIKRYKPAGGRAQYFLTYDQEPVENRYPIQYEWCEETDDECCPDMRIQENLPLTCDESNEGSVEDPEMCTILDACDKNKQKSYDYTSQFGLNENYCTLFCREEIDFTFMDRTEVIAGRQFKYDVNSRITTTQMLSTVIYGTRQCTSPEIEYEKWERDYLAADRAIASAWNNLKFWEALYNHIGEYVSRFPTCRHSTGCCDRSCTRPCSINGKPSTCSACCDSGCSISCGTYEVKYWGTNGSGPFPYNRSDVNGNESRSNATHTSGSCSANCCSGTCVPRDGTDSVIRSSYRTAVNSYKAALEKREKLLMDIQNCNLLSYSNFTYKPETYYVASSAGSYRYNYNESSTAYYKIVNQYNFNSVIQIDYDDDYSPMISIESDEPIQHSITQSWCKDCDYDTYCSSCGSNPAINSSLSTKTDLRRLVCTGSETGADCEIKDTTVPDNHAANITTSKEQHFWQSAKFYTQLYSGIVSTVPDGQGYWIGLDDYIYPITLNKENGSYGVHVDISNIGAATRPDNIKIDDQEFECAFDVINETTMYECDPRIEDCYIECDPSVEVCDEYDEPTVGLGMVVRSVDLTDLFPTNRPKGMNWENAANVITAIQSLGDDIWTAKQPQYTIDLSPTNIRNIKNYNSYTDYMDYSISCDSSLNCRSEFLTTLSNNTDYAYSVDISAGRNKILDDYNNYYKYGR